ncbi:MAG: hypothetical protein ACREMD_16275 [Gemmatimonadota bacterium]
MSCVQGVENVDSGKSGDSGALLRGVTDCIPWLFLYVLLAVVFLALGATGVDALDLFRDPAELSRLRLPPWEGSLSLLGYMIWIAASTACLLTVAAVRHRRSSERVEFLAATGLIALLFGLDDALLLHENLADRFVGSSGGGVGVLVPYAVAILAWAYRYRGEILASRLGLVFAAGLGFAGSLVLEFWPFLAQLPRADLLEEVLELGGVVMFAIYCVSESYRELVLSAE